MKKILLLLVILFIIILALSLSKENAHELIIMNEEAVGPITKETPFKLKRIQKLLPDYIVKQGSGMTEGEGYPTILVSDKSGLALTITADWNQSNIFTIFTQNSDVTNYLGIKIKTKFKKVFVKDKYKCTPGEEENSGKVFCSAPNSKHLHFEFSGVWNGPDGTLPPFDILKEYEISKILWSAS